MEPPPPSDADGAEQGPVYNPVSKFEEYVEVPGLTLFDIHREPRRVNDDQNARVCAPLKVISLVFYGGTTYYSYILLMCYTSYWPLNSTALCALGTSKTRA